MKVNGMLECDKHGKIQSIEGNKECGNKKWAAILHKAVGAGLTNQVVHMQILGERAKQAKGTTTA